jgi:hypothetical protein
MFKNLVRTFVEKIYKMVFLEGSSFLESKGLRDLVRDMRKILK